jgi:iron(III) transport system substrate-binding protein
MLRLAWRFGNLPLSMVRANCKSSARAAIALAGLLVAGPAAAQAPADWQARWDALLAAAKQEGSITISGPSGKVWVPALAEFGKDYPDIKVSITAFSGRDFWPRFTKERDVGQYLWDVRIGGYDAYAYRLKQQGQIAPVRDLLLLPEILDAKSWRRGLDSLFIDLEHRYVAGFVAVDETLGHYNKKLLPEPWVVDMANLNDPRLTGKISLADPRGGSPLTAMGLLYRRFGPDFIRTLFTVQKPVITNVPRQQLDWLTNGRYPIAIGMPTAMLVEYGRSGGDPADLPPMRGLRTWSIGVGGIVLPTKPPHPAATQLFVNWLLSKKEQTRLMQEVHLNSQRSDVPDGNKILAIDYAHIDEYYGGQGEEMKPYQVKAEALLKELIH